jgi:DoxX-like family
MNVALWVGAAMLAAVFVVSGTVKLVIPREKVAALNQAAEWTLDFSSAALKAIGVIELLGAVGLILPAVLTIAPILVPIAASGAVVLFACAAIMRWRRGERATVVVDLLYLALAAFVAAGRFGPWSFHG